MSPVVFTGLHKQQTRVTRTDKLSGFTCEIAPRSPVYAELSGVYITTLSLPLKVKAPAEAMLTLWVLLKLKQTRVSVYPEFHSDWKPAWKGEETKVVKRLFEAAAACFVANLLSESKLNNHEKGHEKKEKCLGFEPTHKCCKI